MRGTAIKRALAWLAFALFAARASAQPLIGLNLEGKNYYSSEVVFVDAFRQSQRFFAQKDGAAFKESDPGAIEFNHAGYPIRIAPGHAAHSIWRIPRGYPRAEHAILWEGEGDVTLLFAGGGEVLSTRPGRLVFKPSSAANQTFNRGVRIRSTNPDNPVRNIRVVPLKHERAYARGGAVSPFRGVFIERWSSMRAFRYMDWGATNNSRVASWEDRPKPTDQTQGDKGVALEFQIAHANRTMSHPWFTIPHRATDDYVRKAAELIRDTLNPRLVARIEYSNEVWNNLFQQAAYARRQAAALPGQKSDFGGQVRWYSKRSVEVFNIFEEVFTQRGAKPEGMNRLLRVMSSQASNDWVARQVLEYEDAHLKTDVLAIAPYFGDTPQEGAEADAWKNANWEQRIAKVEQSLQTALRRMDNHIALLRDETDAQGRSPYRRLKLFAYEGGQHFVGHPNTHDDPTLTSLMQELSRRPEMREFYLRYLQHWEAIGGGDFMLFASMRPSDQFGNWGLLEHEGQAMADTPKLEGVLAFINGSKARSQTAK